MSAAPLPPIEISPPDISGLRRGNVGVDYVHRFASGRPGPTAMVTALTHGNEICGATALLWLFAMGVRPVRGELILALVNVEAYGRFDPAKPLANRFVDRDGNRVWSRAILDSDDRSVEVRRAREIRPLVDEADALLDIHSTNFAVPAMLIYLAQDKARRAAAAVREPLVHIVSDGGKLDGGPLYEFGRLGRADDDAVGLLVECGDHFARRSGEVATQTTLAFLDYCGVLDKDFVAAHRAPPTPGEPARYEMTVVLKARGEAARFVRPLIGFEEFARGEPIGHDGVDEIRAPYDRCAVLMPKPVLVPGREMVTLARRL